MKIKRIVITILISLGVIAAGVFGVSKLIPLLNNDVIFINPDQLTEISDNKISDLKTSLRQTLINKGYIDEGVQIDDVTIREDSIVSRAYYDSNNKRTKIVSFLVDIDSLQLSYRIKVVDSEEELTDRAITVSCPLASEVHYDSFACEGDYGSSSKSVKNHLPHTLTLKNGEKVYIKKVEATAGGSQLLKIYLYSCESESPASEEASTAVKKWVKELKDPLVEFYTYEVRTGYCDGDAI